MVERGVAPERWWRRWRCGVAQEALAVGIGDLAGGEQKLVNPDAMNGLLVVLSRVAAHEETSRGDAGERESRVVVTTSGCRACARHGPFDFPLGFARGFGGGLARASVPTRACSGSRELLRRFCWGRRVHG